MIGVGRLVLILAGVALVIGTVVVKQWCINDQQDQYGSVILLSLSVGFCAVSIILMLVAIRLMSIPSDALYLSFWLSMIQLLKNRDPKGEKAAAKEKEAEKKKKAKKAAGAMTDDFASLLSAGLKKPKKKK